MSLSSQIVLAFAPASNEKRADATGAFHPEARAFLASAAGGELVLIDNRRPFAARRAQVVATLKARADRGFTSVAFFCHGFANGIQLGFRNAHAPELAKRAAFLTGNMSLVLPLYCCSTGVDLEGDAPHAPGWGDNSFADRLRDALCAEYATHCRVFAHTTLGHTTQNPHAVVFDGMGSELGGAGGYAPVLPRSALWRTWVRWLREPENTLRFRAPYMTIAELHAELSTPATQTAA